MYTLALSIPPKAKTTKNYFTQKIKKLKSLQAKDTNILKNKEKFYNSVWKVYKSINDTFYTYNIEKEGDKMDKV